MTVEQMISDMTGEFDEYGLISYSTIEDNLELVFEYFFQLPELMETDVYKELEMKLEDPTASYHERVIEHGKRLKEQILEKPQSDYVNSVGDGQIRHTDSFGGFRGFSGNVKTQIQTFNPELIPDLNQFIRAVSESLQVDFGMVAPAVLTTVASALQKKCIVHLQGDHVESPNLYTVIVAEASERKSPTMKAITKPIYEYEQQLNEEKQPEISAYKTKKSILERKVKALTDKSIKNNGSKSKDNVSIEDIIAAQQELDELEEVAPVTLIADDTTSEALIRLMGQNEERIAIMSTEGGIFGSIAGRYSKEANMDIYLKGYSGDPLRESRMGRKGQTLNEPLLTVLIYVQPVVIQEVMSNAEFVGRGLPARFLYVYPPSMIGRRKYEVEAIPEYRKDEMWNVLNRLLKIPVPPTPTVVEPDEEAMKLSRDYFYKVDKEIVNAPSSELRAWIGKLYGNTMRIALCLHCIKYLEDFGSHKIDKETMHNAIELGWYFLGQARKAYANAGLTDPPEVRDAKYIMQRIDSTGKMELSLREVQRLCADKKGMEDKKGMVPGINCLIAHGYIRVQKVKVFDKTDKTAKTPKKGGRPSEIVYVNPEYIKWKEQNKA